MAHTDLIKMKLKLLFFVCLIIPAAFVSAQQPGDSLHINKVFIGVNAVPNIFSSSSSIFPNYTLGYKRALKKFTLRTGLSGNAGVFNDSMRSKRMIFVANAGLEKRMNIVRNHFFVIFGFEGLLSYKNTVYDAARIDYYGFGVGPVIGLEYIFRLGNSEFSVCSETGFYLMEQVSKLNEKNVRKSNDSRLVSGLQKLAGFTLNYIF
ncbi:MAG: hypothetical protein WCM76_08430 [Bacteroidota bacterium]